MPTACVGMCATKPPRITEMPEEKEVAEKKGQKHLHPVLLDVIIVFSGWGLNTEPETGHSEDNNAETREGVAVSPAKYLPISVNLGALLGNYLRVIQNLLDVIAVAYVGCSVVTEQPHDSLYSFLPVSYTHLTLPTKRIV